MHDPDAQTERAKTSHVLHRSAGRSKGLVLAMQSAFGFDLWGYDAEGYNRFGFTEHGRNRAGLFWDGYDDEGYDFNGYDYHGYDRNGLDRNGTHRTGQNALAHLDYMGIRSKTQLLDFVCVYIDGYSVKNAGAGYGIFWEHKCVYNRSGSVSATTGFDACLFAMSCALAQIIDIIQRTKGYRFFLICRNPKIWSTVTEFARLWSDNSLNSEDSSLSKVQTNQKILKSVSHQIAWIVEKHRTDLRFGFPMHGTDLYGIRIATWLAIHAAHNHNS